MTDSLIYLVHLSALVMCVFMAIGCICGSVFLVSDFIKRVFT